MTYSPSKIYNIKLDSKDPHLELSNKSTTKKLFTNNEDSNSLTGLLAHYNSDSEHEDMNGQDTEKLDAKVDDFLQEINKLAPGNKQEKNNDTEENISTQTWQECFDESSGYPYYWNIETNVVTWEMPEEYKNWLSQIATENIQEKPSDYDNPHQAQVNKIINEEINKATKDRERKIDTRKKKTISQQKVMPQSTDSEEERIVLITSFSEDSSSDSDSEKNDVVNTPDNSTKEENADVVMGPHLQDIPKELRASADINSIPNDITKKEIIVENIKDENIDETVILSRLRTQAKVLQELGGELPKSVDRSIILTDKNDTTLESSKAQSLSLVAGYGDDSEEEETTNKSVFSAHMKITDTFSESSQSTLFPITKPIDVKQFESTNQTQSSEVEKENNASIVDNKIFKRKKRLGISFGIPYVKSEKRLKIEEESFHIDINDEERKGFGFQVDTELMSNEKPDKIAFKKGGIAFVKADILNPVGPIINKVDDKVLESEIITEDFDDIKEVVGEKVRFLSEGKDPVSAVQVMLIQLQTLEAAFKSGGLSEKYFYSWLRETFSDLGKLEDDAAPNGWRCQWDRLNKRYFYRNQQTGETQWEYPDPDIVGGGEAMDICTTPPPNEEAQELCEIVAPSPPKIREASLSPPPPPIFSSTDRKVSDTFKTNTDELESNTSSARTSPVIIVTENQPLPPGVDSPDLSYFPNLSKEPPDGSSVNPTKDTLVSELDSFYSDIAMLEATSTSNTEAVKSDAENVPSPSTSETVSNDQIILKKKKRSKPKIGQRLDMKKKAVSSLVEKWKKVQNDYL